MPDLAVQVRDAAVAVLLEQNTLAGTAVERERIDPAMTGDTPRIAVFADETAETASRAGTAPAFDVTLNLVVQCLVERADKEDAVNDLDTMVSQVKEALFGDAAWVAMTENLASFRTTRSFKGENERIIADARILITCTWREIYPPRVTQPLLLFDLAPHPVTPGGATTPPHSQVPLAE